MRSLTLFIMILVLLFSEGGQSLPVPPEDTYSLQVVKSLLNQPAGISTSFGERQAHRMGDRFSIALLKVIQPNELHEPAVIRKIIPLVRLAFAYPSLISHEQDRQPDITLFVLHFISEQVKDPVLRKELSATAEWVKTQTATKS